MTPEFDPPKFVVVVVFFLSADSAHSGAARELVMPPPLYAKFRVQANTRAGQH